MDKYSLQNVEFFCKLFCYNFDDGENVETLGMRIRKLREKKKLTQEELAHKLYLSDKTISSWEKDRTLPSLNIIVMLSDLLDTTTTYLIYGDIKKLEVETEIKIPISKKQYEDLKLYFKDHGKFIRESMQEDTYYIQNIIVF